MKRIHELPGDFRESLNIRYSGLNAEQQQLLDGLGDRFSFPFERIEEADDHFHRCHDCRSTWSHSGLCSEPENVTAICPNCEEESYASPE